MNLPASGGPHPVVVLIHGGGWKAAYATLRDLAPLADALKAEGIASWNIEYRRLPRKYAHAFAVLYWHAYCPLI